MHAGLDCTLGDVSGVVVYERLTTIAKTCDDCGPYQSLLSSYLNGNGAPTDFPATQSYDCASPESHEVAMHLCRYCAINSALFL